MQRLVHNWVRPHWGLARGTTPAMRMGFFVFHGPLEAGDNLTVEDDAILFRSKIGNNVAIGHRAIVVGVKLRDGARVPENAVIITQAQADAVRTRRSIY